jgi:hypothetical protein
MSASGSLSMLSGRNNISPSRLLKNNRFSHSAMRMNQALIPGQWGDPLNHTKQLEQNRPFWCRFVCFSCRFVDRGRASGFINFWLAYFFSNLLVCGASWTAYVTKLEHYLPSRSVGVAKRSPTATKLDPFGITPHLILFINSNCTST